MAASKGAKGLLMYPDPQTYAPDGLGKNSTYPNSPWLSSDAVLLAGIYGEFGDPLTKNLPSQEGIYYKAVKDWSDILPILLQPISYGTARFLLEQAGGKYLRFLKRYSCIAKKGVRRTYKFSNGAN